MNNYINGILLNPTCPPFNPHLAPPCPTLYCTSTPKLKENYKYGKLHIKLP